MNRVDQVFEQMPEDVQITPLGPLPHDWPVVRLGEVFDFTRGISWGKKDEDKSGTPVIAIPNIKNGKVSFEIKYHLKKNISINKRLQNNDILLVGSSGSLHNVGRTAIVENLPFSSATFASFLVKAIPINSNNKYFCYYLLKSPLIDFSSSCKRAADGKYNLQLNQLKETLIPLPPLAEQQAIAHVLRAIQEAKEKTEAAANAAKSLKASLLRHLFTYGPVPLANTESIPLQDTPIGKIPSHWQVVRLGDLENQGHLWLKNGFPQGKHNQSGQGVPHLRPFNVNHAGNIDLKQIKFIAPSQGNVCWVKRGDVIFNNTNSQELVGKTAYFDLQGKFTISNHMTLIRAIEKAINPFWIAKYLHWLWYKGFFRTICRRHVNQSSISLQRLRQVLIPLPPLAEQQAIARILQAVDEKIEAERQKARAYEALFQSFLHNLMTAKTRLPKAWVDQFTEPA